MNSPGLKQILAGARNTAVFVAAFVLMCWAIRSVLPFPRVPVVHAKLAHLREHIDNYDSLFIGSSRIYRHVVPTSFDRLMAETGTPTRSFNAGVDGMRPPEDAYLLDRIFALKPKHLRYVFVELGGLRLLPDEDKKGTIRSVYWHDWERLTVLFRRAIYQKKKRDLPGLYRALREPLGIFAGHIELFAQNITNLGRGEVLIPYLKGLKSDLPAKAVIGENRDGYTVANLPQTMPEQTRIEYERALAERKLKPATMDLADPVSQDTLERMVAKIEQIGAIPVLIVPPTTNAKNFVPRPELAKRVHVFDFSDVHRYPELFENRHRQDTNHVNGAGAEVFTHLLAKEFSIRMSGTK